MNKNHLLPALLFVLAACGGTTSSSAPASSIALDTNEYRFIGGQANIGSWSPANAPVMTRAAGTNAYSWTGDLYEDSTWKLVIGTDWANGEVGPLSAGLTIIDKGVTWTKDAEGALVIPEDSNSGFDPGLGGVGNFSTKVDGNYTVTFVSLPALTRTFTIVRNGDPEVLPPSITDWALVGTINGWNAADQSFKLANLNDENESYSLTVNLYANEEFKFVKNGAWGGDLGFAALANPNPLDLLDQGGNIKVVRDGSYTVAFDGETATVERAGSLVRPEGGLHLVGTVTESAWTPSDTTLALTDTAGDAKYYGVFDLAVNSEFKIKNGTAWDVGFDAGFDKVASLPVGAMESAGGNIKVLVGHAFLIEARIVGGSVRIVISPAWKTYGFPSLVYAPGVGTTAGYLNTTAEFWNAHAQMRVYGMDGTKTKVNFEYTGVATHEYLFKIEGNGAAKEARSVATGERQTYTLDISDLSETQRAGLNLVVFFHTLPTSPVEGTITVHSVSFAA
ncbi:MAG: SusF/SusE family outer membrane protein [Bacilli bacterium]